MSFVDDETKKKIIDAYLSNPESRRKFASTMAQPLRTRMDYQSVGRRTFMVDELPGFHCPKCTFTHKDKNYVHSEEECSVNEVLAT